MREPQEQPPTAEQLDEALKRILSVDLYYDLPELVETCDGGQFVDSLMLRDALHAIHLHLTAQGHKVTVPPMANLNRTTGLMRGRRS